MKKASENVTNKRLEKFRSCLRDMNISAALITRRENYMYLSGFTGTSAYLLINDTDALLVTDFRYAEQAAAQAPAYKIVEYRGSIMSALKDELKKLGAQNLGFEDNFVTFEQYGDFKEKLEVSELVPLKGTVERLRYIKDDEELKILRKAVEIADNAFAHILGFIKPGVSEIEIAAEIEFFMRKQGATGASFETIVASGERSSMPHGVASERKLRIGDPITMDYGALYQGYCSDMTRTVFLGEASQEMKKIYGIVLDAQIQASQAAAEGLEGKEIDAVARDIITKNGYGNNFGHGLGHGVGLEIHEEPRLSPAGAIKMENGMAVTVEPGIYINGLGGVRIEDIIIINGKDPIVLTKSTKDLIII